jgi:hypothetical protein
MKYILYIFFTLFTVPIANAQIKSNCPILDGKMDTVFCEGRKIQIELSFCESNGLFQDGVATDMNGNEEFCFYYNYDKLNKLKSITFWTFQWKNGGYVTKNKIGVLKISGDKQELIIKRGFTLSRDFVKLVTKT